MTLGSLRVSGRAEQALRPAGIPARLRSLLAVPGRGKKAEPRVRYGQQFLPGLSVFGRHLMAEARLHLERADAIRRELAERGYEVRDTDEGPVLVRSSGR